MTEKDCVHYKLTLCRVDHKPRNGICGIFKTQTERDNYLKEVENGRKYVQHSND